MAAAPGAAAPSVQEALAQEELEINAADDGRAYLVAVGSKIFIALPAGSRPIGRWRWRRAASDLEVVSRLEKPSFLKRPTTTADDIDGFQLFSFVAEEPGRSIIELSLRKHRRFHDAADDDDEDEIDDRFAITLDVH
jgi:hypothetical protein